VQDYIPIAFGYGTFLRPTNFIPRSNGSAWRAVVYLLDTLAAACHQLALPFWEAVAASTDRCIRNSVHLWIVGMFGGAATISVFCHLECFYT